MATRGFGLIHDLVGIEGKVRSRLLEIRHQIDCAWHIITNGDGKGIDEEACDRAASLLAAAQESVKSIIGD